MTLDIFWASMYKVISAKDNFFRLAWPPFVESALFTHLKQTQNIKKMISVTNGVSYRPEFNVSELLSGMPHLAMFIAHSQIAK